MSSDGAAAGGLDEARRVEAVDVNRLVAESIGDLFALHDEELLVGAVQRVEAVDAGQVVVIGQRDEVVVVLAIPPHHIVRRRIAVAVQGVGVEVALEPLGLAGAGLGPVGAAARRRHRRRTQQAAVNSEVRGLEIIGPPP